MSDKRDNGCHYSWNWLTEHLKNKPLQYIRDRIESLDREVVFQEEQTVKRDLPRLYALKGFLTHRRGETEGDDKLLKEGKDFLKKALSECSANNLGYKFVIISNLKHITTANEKKQYANKLQEVCSGDDDVLMQEVHAMQAHAAGHFHIRKLCIEQYEKAGKSQAEWCFGLALANEKNNSYSPLQSKLNEWQEILDLLDDAIRLDQTYIEAKLKKAKILFHLERSEQADIILQGILKAHNNSLKIKEDVALAYTKENPQMAIDLFQECLNTDHQRQKSLRGIAHSYVVLFNSSGKPENLELSIKYQKELVNRTDNAKIFDLTTLADTLRRKYIFDKNIKMKNDLKKIFDKIIDKLNKKQLSTSSEIETCFRVSNYYRVMNIEDEEIKYLGKVLEKIVEAKLENNSKTSRFIEKAKKRLQQFIKKEHSSFLIKVWLLKSDEKFDKTIRCLENKENEEGITDFDKEIFLKEKASCFVKWIQNEETAPEITRALLKDVENAMSQIKIGDESRLNYIYQLIPEDDDTKKMKVIFGKFINKIQNIEGIDKDLYSELIKESKLVLDRTIHYLYIVAVPDGDPKQNTFYPSISEFKDKTEDERLKSLVKKLKGIFWRGVKKKELDQIDLLGKIPQLNDFNRYFDFHKYPWYDKLNEIRGSTSHKPVHIAVNSLEALDEIQEIAIMATLYAACVFRFVKTI